MPDFCVCERAALKTCVKIWNGKSASGNMSTVQMMTSTHCVNSKREFGQRQSPTWQFLATRHNSCRTLWANQISSWRHENKIRTRQIWNLQFNSFWTIVLLPTLFIVVNNIQQYCWAWIGCNNAEQYWNVVDNYQQYGQQNLLSNLFSSTLSMCHWPNATTCSFLLCSHCWVIKFRN
jgi:hypothetical protein